MTTLTVTAKGQVTLRKDLLKHLGVHPGEKVTVDKLPDGRIEMKALRPTGSISDVFDFLKRENGPPLSVEEINGIPARGWAGKRGRLRPIPTSSFGPLRAMTSSKAKSPKRN